MNFLPQFNFLSLPPEYSAFESSKALILPVPYEATTSYGGGTKRGPEAILAASAQVELYDREFDREAVFGYGVHTLPFLALNLSSQEAALAEIAEAVAHFAATGKLLGVLGGEHSLSLGVAQGLQATFGEFVTVQIDAHADLRNEFEGTIHSHACAMRRVLELGCGPLVQVGIRSLDVSEEAFRRANTDRIITYFAEEIHRDRSQFYLADLATRVQGKPVYLTIDVDGFDSALMPATGTPEPGGLLWYDVLDVVRTVATAAERIVGFDCVELAPIPGQHAPDFLTAKLVYKVLSHALLK